jgi:hypothetical protein
MHNHTPRRTVAFVLVYGRVCWIVVVVDVDATGAGIGGGVVVVVCSLVVVLVTVSGLLQAAANKAPAASAAIVNR